MRLYIIRHGETDWNKQKRLQGRSDIPLNEFGRELARVTAKAFTDVSFDIVYSSPLIRAYETAQIMTGGKCDIIKDDRLTEISFGNDEGLFPEDRRESFMDFFFAPEKYIASEGGESYEDVCMRAKDFLEDKIYPLKDTDKTVAIFAHGALNKALMLNLKNLEICDIWKGEFQHNCCVNLFEITNEGIKVLEEAKVYYELKDTFQ